MTILDLPSDLRVGVRWRDLVAAVVALALPGVTR